MSLFVRWSCEAQASRCTEPSVSQQTPHMLQLRSLTLPATTVVVLPHDFKVQRCQPCRRNTCILTNFERMRLPKKAFAKNFATVRIFIFERKEVWKCVRYQNFSGKFANLLVWFPAHQISFDVKKVRLAAHISANLYQHLLTFAAIDTLVRRHGRSSVGRALRFVRQKVLTSAAGARQNVPRIVLVVTGKSDDLVEEAAADLRAVPNVAVLVVGVRNADQVILWNGRGFLEVQPQRFFDLHTFGALNRPIFNTT